MRAIHLQTEYLIAPLGLGLQKPRLMWNAENGIKQTAYHIVTKNWDSGIVETSSMRAEYPIALESREQVEWKISLCDENHQWGEWTSSTFEMGLLHPSDWHAQWISGNYRPNGKTRYPVDCFKKEFSIKNVKKARLYATARGIYDVTINGTRLTNFVFAPGTTDYRKRIQYQTYDVTAFIQNHNVMEIRLADGWYRGSTAAYGFTTVYGVQTSIMAQLELVFDDGSSQIIVTDESWSWSCDGPIRFADLQDGEIVDASLVPSYSGKALVVKAPQKVVLCASDNVPGTEHERFNATLLKNNVLDFGQNIAGYMEFKIQGEKGQKVHLVFGEILDENGNVTLKNIQETKPVKGWTQLSLIQKLLTGTTPGPSVPTPLQEIEFTCSGKMDVYKTSFAIFGFRYVQVSIEGVIIPENYTAISVYSDLERTGYFECSNKKVNQLFENTVWSMKSNFLDVPTDCPTRERLGWTGDAQIFFTTGAYIMNTAPFFRKWLRDMQDSQYASGTIPAVLPFSGGEMVYKTTGASVGWADAVYLIPYRYSKIFGDERVLRDSLPMMNNYVKYLLSHLGQKNKKDAENNPYNSFTYEKGMHLGEWLEPIQFQEAISANSRPLHTEEATAYLYLTMKTMAEIAECLGDREQQAYYLKMAEGSKKAYQQFSELDTDRQAKLVRPLAFGLLDGEIKEAAQKRLVLSAENNSYHVGTGFLSTPFLLPMLTKAGRTDVAYKTLLNTGNPGWLYEVEQNATSIWETWEGDLSQNHYSPGAVCQWLFEYSAGMRVKGENVFEIAPHWDKSLSFVKASYHSAYGRVSCSWETSDEGFLFTCNIPANTTAEIQLPNGRTEVVSAGTHTYQIEK